MTRKERIAFLEKTDRETLSPAEVASVLGGSAYQYNLSAKEGRLDLPHVWRGRNLRILRQPLLNLIKGGN